MNILIIIFAIAYCIVENWFFGWNLFPQSGAEIVADIVGAAILAAGIFARE